MKEMDLSIGLFKSEWATVNGLQMHARVSRKMRSEVPDVVLVHGMGLSARYMMPLAEQLVDDFNVWVPDHPGYGLSDKPPLFLGMEEIADSIAQWMDVCGLSLASMLGNSFGCQIIVEFAKRHPDKISRGVLQGPTVPKDERTHFWQFIRWRQNSRTNPPSLAPLIQRDYKDCGYARLYQTYLLGFHDKMEEKLPTIETPMLVVRGEKDPICHQGWVEEVTRLLPRGELKIIPKVTHTLCYTAPRELADVSRPFLQVEQLKM